MFRCAKPKSKPKMETQNISNNENKHQNLKTSDYANH